MKKHVITLLFCSFCTLSLFAQSETQRFGAQLIGGLTASQIDGDASAGYNKLGFVAGVNTLIYLKEKSYASVGILLCQRGAQNEVITKNAPNAANHFSLRLDYIEVPVLFHYRDWLADEDAQFYKMDFHAGLAYGRLFGTRLRDDLGAINDVVDRLQKNDVSMVVGGAYHLSKKFSIAVQYRRSFVSLYSPNQQTAASPRGVNWISHLLSMHGAYSF